MRYESYMQCLIRSNAFETMCLCRGGARVAKCIIIPHSLACKIVTQKLHPHQRKIEKKWQKKLYIYIYIMWCQKFLVLFLWKWNETTKVNNINYNDLIKYGLKYTLRALNSYINTLWIISNYTGTRLTHSHLHKKEPRKLVSSITV